MIISHSRRFTFVHITKAAGTSIENALEPFLAWNDVYLGSAAFDSKAHDTYQQRFALHKHSSVADIERVCGTRYTDEFFLFALVRHPVDRLCSLYNFVGSTIHRWANSQNIDPKTAAHFIDDDIRAAYPFLHWQSSKVFVATSSFSEFIRSSDLHWEVAFEPQLTRLTGANGGPPKGKIFRLEESHLWLPMLQERLGIVFSFGHENRSDLRLVSPDQLSPDDRKYIETAFADDYAAFGYDDARPGDRKVFSVTSKEMAPSFVGRLVRRLGGTDREKARVTIKSKLAELDERVERIGRQVWDIQKAVSAPGGNNAETFADELRQRLSEIREIVSAPRAVGVGNGRVLLKARVLDLMYLVDAADRLLAPHLITHGILEVATTNFLLRHVKPGNRFLDIGTNFGYFTCMGARLAGATGRVHGFEADPQTFEYVRDNVYINWLESVVTLHNVAISNEDGELSLHRRLTRSGNTSIIKIDDADLARLGEKPSERFTVAARSLDSLASEIGPIDVAKIDVEGAEPLVMAGAANFVAANPAIKITMEWAPAQLAAAGFSPAELLDRLVELGFTFHIIHEDGGLSPVDRTAFLSSGFDMMGLLGPAATQG